jgi:HAD superfamily hydrolase (TIGR01450 family)
VDTFPKDIKGFLLDLDGVTWVGNQLAPGAAAFWEHCRQRGLRIAFVSNSSAKSRTHIRQKLEKLGLPGVVDDQIFPATRAAAQYVAARCHHPRVFVIGEHGLLDELAAAEAVIVEQDAQFVIVGADRHIVYERLERACQEILAGAELVATGADGNYPTEYGLRPGAGAFKAFLEACTGKVAVVVGKPQTELLQQALDYLNVHYEDAVMVGDTPETDLIAANRVGIRGILIGNDTQSSFIGEMKPDLFCRDLGDLLRILLEQS